MAAHAGAMPPTRGAAERAGVAVIVKITPEPFLIICRAAALAVRKCALVYVRIGTAKLSGDSSRRETP
jgi:hypothetical protein